MNRVCKDSLCELHLNKTGHAIMSVGKCIGTLTKILDQYDNCLGIISTSGYHNAPLSTKDRNLIVEELTMSRVFEPVPQQYHTHFPKLISKLNLKSIHVDNVPGSSSV